MGPLTYFLALIISYLGIFLGIILRKITLEETGQYKKILMYISRMIMGLILLSVLYYGTYSYVWGAIGGVIGYALFSPKRIMIAVIYGILSALFFFSSFVQESFIICSFLIFIYGFIMGTLEKDKNKKISVIIRQTIFYVIIGGILFFFI